MNILCFEGDLGPSTIVGSAAFNLFVIIAICIWVSVMPESPMTQICVCLGDS